MCSKQHLNLLQTNDKEYDELTCAKAHKASNTLLSWTDTSEYLTLFPIFPSSLSGGGAGLHHLLAAVPHRQEPVRPGG